MQTTVGMYQNWSHHSAPLIKVVARAKNRNVCERPFGTPLSIDKGHVILFLFVGLFVCPSV